MTSSTTAPILPDYAPVPTTALGPALNDQGYYVGRVERNLHWVTDVVGDVVLEVAALAPRSIALASFGLDSLIEIGALHRSSRAR